jgi:hypothetical protein
MKQVEAILSEEFEVTEQWGLSDVRLRDSICRRSTALLIADIFVSESATEESSEFYL